MDNEHFANLLEQLGDMSQSQLAQVVTATEDILAGRLSRFNHLCAQLEGALRAIDIEFPNANVYLSKSPTEQVNLMDLLIPQDFVKKCEIGD